MGREIRRVPEGWEHPTQECEHSPWAGGCGEAKRNNGRCYRPLYDRSFATEAREWLDAAIAWDNGTDPDCAEHKATHPFYWQWSNGPPDPAYYRPEWSPEEMTHYQVYETVSEGTPVTPVFASKAELVEYLVTYGDFWDQVRVIEGKQTHAGWQRKNAEAFVGREWAPSAIFLGGVMQSPRDMT